MPRFPPPGNRGDARAQKDPSRPLQPVLLVAGVSKDGESTVKPGGGRGRWEGRGPVDSRGGA
jgi:hypothetical protein